MKHLTTSSGVDDFLFSGPIRAQNEINALFVNSCDYLSRHDFDIIHSNLEHCPKSHSELANEILRDAGIMSRTGHSPLLKYLIVQFCREIDGSVQDELDEALRNKASDFVRMIFGREIDLSVNKN